MSNALINHPVNLFSVRVEGIKSKLMKRAREEVVLIPTLYTDALIELSTQPDSQRTPHLDHPCTKVPEAGMSVWLQHYF